MGRFLFFSLFLLTYVCKIPAGAQGQDTLIHYQDITYSSDFEREMFREYFQEEKDNYLGIFMALDSDITEKEYNQYAQQFNIKLNSINKDKLKKKKAKKKIKYLYDDIHEMFLKKYEYENHFSNIFSSGYYNCVSGSALYGLVFNYLNIPFVIKEKPTHVYLMAYPDSDRILVEPTDPRKGYLTINSSYKNTFVENLKAAKIIGVDEAVASSTDQLFDKYYFVESNISLRELVGIQYTNDALYKLEKNAYEEAYYQLEKAYLFYPSEKVSTLMFISNAEILSNATYDDLKYASLLAKFSRHKKFGVSNDNILAEFMRVNNALLIDKGDSEKYESFYTALIKELKDPDLQKEISFLYNYENGRVAYNRGNYEDALPYLEKAYVLKPENHDINNVFITTIAQRLRFISDNKKAIKFLEGYSRDFSNLLNNTIFKSMLGSAYLTEFFYSFDLNNPAEGLKYKKLFTEIYSHDLKVEEFLIGRAYSTAAVYYFRRGNKTKALSMLDQGLKVAPGNHELLSRKKMLR